VERIVAPEHGPTGTPVTVTAEGLPAGEEFQLVWLTVDAAWKVTDAEYHGREYRAVAYEIAKAKTDQAGIVGDRLGGRDYRKQHLRR